MTSPVYAQIIPDNTLEVNSSVAPGCTACTIEGGTVRGNNLFHSFSEFSVPKGGEAFFNNAMQIQNILTRVTGNSGSNIDGMIRTNGTANLFLINPNGIIFNSNASLNIGGSFIASTANSLNFSDGIKFSAVNSQTPPLLTINVPIGLQFGTNPAKIQAQGSSLEVNPGQTLALVGGNVQLHGGKLIAPGGNVELGGMADTGTVGLSINGSYLGLSFPDGVERADVSLSNGTDVNVLAGGGGRIAINARFLDMIGENTKLESGIASGLGSVDSRAGDIEIKATQAINLNGSGISNTVQSTAVGKSGDINIKTGSLYVRNGGVLNTETSGRGNAGNIKIVARDTVSFDGGTSSNSRSSQASSAVQSQASSAVQETGVGKGGNIDITTGSLSVTNGGELVATNYGGKGDAGSVNITAGDTVTFDGIGRKFPSGAFSNVLKKGVGNGTSINITTGSLDLKNGAVLNVTTDGKGNAGNVNIFARDRVSLDGVSSVLSAVEKGAEGQGGNIYITTGSLSVTNGGELIATNYGGKGDAGSVNITAGDTVTFDGIGSNGYPSGAFSNVFPKGVGNGTSINITTGSLDLKNGAVLNVRTYGKGNAGSVNIFARDRVSLDGVSSVLSAVEKGAEGQGGNIYITTGSLSVTNGGELIATNYGGKGDAGSVNITAGDTVTFDGIGSNGYPSGAFSNVLKKGVGNGTGINITTGSLNLRNGAVLNVRTEGKGDAGSVNIVARDTVSLDGVSSVLSAVEKGAEGQGGNIYIRTGSFRVSNGAQLSAATSGLGDAGNVNIFAQDTVSLEGAGNNGRPSGAYSTVESTGVGKGGDINITTKTLSLKDGAFLSVRTRGQGDGGNITLWANTLEAISGGQVITTSSGSDKAGNINLNVTDSITLSGSNANYFARLDQFIARFGSNQVLTVDPASGLFANTSETSTGRGGELTINTNQFNIQDGAKVTVSSQGSGIAGSLIVEANSIYLDNKATISADTKGGQGNINLRSRDLLLLRRGSSITTNAFGNATGGNITIDTNNLVAVPKENSDISANAQDSFGGRVIVNASGIFGTQFRLQPTPLSDITASSARGSQFNGVVQLNTPDVNPSQGLTALPTNIIDTSQLIANSCITRNKRPEGKFIITGNGGLPVMPDDPSIAPYQTYQIPTVQSASISRRQENALDPENPTTSNKPYDSVKSAPLIEAQGWMYGYNGEVILTASAPTVSPHNSWSQLPPCSGS
ncbi:MAG: filamentous hemagglutinin N-terminal domain-containing protein [Nostoc sp.]|uniref:two-partner secretion domain-containing protein n=1 Tax=Nostoc sp. TaxID=1180 RepID=UPI002FFAA6B0